VINLVVDASVALAWALPSQGTAAATALTSPPPTWNFLAPNLFAYEVRNALLAAQRNRRIEASVVDREISNIFAVVELAPPPDAELCAMIMTLARANGLSFYDAAYLEFCLRTSSQLASRDSALLNAGAQIGLVIYDAR
jgi:predicted nucleic acid-binding protein